MKILRVFPRRTNASPDDNDVRFSVPSLFDVADLVHISVTFTYDLTYADYLYNQWKHVAPTIIGGPAVGDPPGTFVPGQYLKHGYVITSRGCNNSCWFCYAWKREGKIKELPIVTGWNILDNNLLACSENHIKSVFSMLKKQPQKPCFTGGLEAKYITHSIASQLYDLRPSRLYFAYDTPDDLEPLQEAGFILKSVGFGKSHDLMCYALCGFPGDTFNNALTRFKSIISAGFMPYSMLYRNDKGVYDPSWIPFNSQWCNPVKCASNMKKLNIKE